MALWHYGTMALWPYGCAWMRAFTPKFTKGRCPSPHETSRRANPRNLPAVHPSQATKPGLPLGGAPVTGPILGGNIGPDIWC